jgi:heparosan-N-sulfate-glucuronate 5-epimerase
MPTSQRYVLPIGRQSPFVPLRQAVGRQEQVDPLIVLTKGHVSTERVLGEYYIDFVPSFSNYSEYRYGVFDDDGVPFCCWSEDAYYNPVTIAQYGFILHSLHMRGVCSAALPTLTKLLGWFEKNKSTTENREFWRQQAPSENYGLPTGFVCGMAIGEAISLYLRMYQLVGDPTLLATAEGAYRFLTVPFEAGGVRRVDTAGHLWFEEYPTEPPSYVLNGFIYILFGLYDLFRVTGEPGVKRDIEACLDTLRANLPRYDVGYWSLYDQLKRELVSVYYQRNVHVPQMEVLYALTGDPVFRIYADRWRRNLRPATRLLAQVMMRVRPRTARLRRWLSAARRVRAQG